MATSKEKEMPANEERGAVGKLFTKSLPPAREEHLAAGKALRKQVSRNCHAAWQPASGRPDPVELLVDSSKGRVPELVPIRYGRMMQTPFTFYRGAAAIMAADLSATPVSGIRVQACGDCHLLNFGGFATPERRLAFDINDFDETLPAPWEWDVKRLAASFVIAGRNNGFKKNQSWEAARTAVHGYREKMAGYAGMGALEAWYDSLDLDDIVAESPDAVMRKFHQKAIAKARARSVAEDDYPRMVEHAGGKPVIKDNPPLIYHLNETQDPGWEKRLLRVLERYRDTLPEDRQVLFDRYTYADVAVKVVGVGSVGTLCGVVLMFAPGLDPLFLQIKEARVSVLEPYAGRSAYPNRGQRVVVGQRIMQSASDIFLGWATGDKGRHFYLRQLRDMKVKPVVEVFRPRNLISYAGVCGWALARAHARSGQAGMISGYLGRSEAFDEAVADFAAAYADQNENDHAALLKAIREGRVEARVVEE